MTGAEGRTETEVAATGSGADRPRGFPRWIAANIGTAIPVSMAPITFGLATLSIQGDVNGGALMMMAMTATQVVGAVPIAAAGRRFSVTAYARALAAFRTFAFVGLGVAVAGGAPLPVVVVAAGLAGLVNGAIFGLLRAILNDMVAANKLPRALGIAATANELIFVIGPVLASTIGGASVLLAVGIMAVASALPLVMLPRIAHRPPPSTHVGPEAIRLGAVVWLLAAGSASSCVASIEVGAVALTLRYELAPSSAFFFTVPLCVGSVLGGIWISVRNRRLRQRTVVAMLLLTVAGIGAVAWDGWIGSAILGAVLTGLFLAPLGTAFSLYLEDVLPPARRAEGFALLRTSNAAGLIMTSSVIAFGSLAVAFLVAGALACVSAVVIAVHAVRPFSAGR